MSSERPIVTFSAGDPPADDLVVRGLGTAHVDDGVLRVARAVLRKNLDAAYAGSLRGDGFTTSLADDTGKVVLGPRFISFLGWPFSANLTPAQIADTLGLCRFVLVDPGFPTSEVASISEALNSGWPMAQATTATRECLFSDQACTDINSEPVGRRVGQILFAGKAFGFLGLIPGIAEEALCALRSNLAVYIVGAFGGAARLLAEALTTSQMPEAFTIDAHRADKNFTNMIEGAEAAGMAGVPVQAFGQLQETIKEVRGDFGRLNNGLTPDENQELMLTSDLGKVVRLITKGLESLE